MDLPGFTWRLLDTLFTPLTQGKHALVSSDRAAHTATTNYVAYTRTQPQRRVNTELLAVCTEDGSHTIVVMAIETKHQAEVAVSCVQTSTAHVTTVERGKQNDYTAHALTFPAKSHDTTF